MHLFDHIDMRVRGLTRVRPLYDALLPAMGYTEIHEGENCAGYHRPGDPDREPFIWLVEDAQHRPNMTRIAFAAPSRSEVDRLASTARSAGAQAFEAPEPRTEYSPNYYAAFFEDADGNKFEICCRAAE